MYKYDILFKAFFSGLTSDAASLQMLTSNKELMTTVWYLLGDKDKKLAVMSGEILVNITSHSEENIDINQTLPIILKIFHDTNSPHLYNNLAMILNNISRSPSQAEVLSTVLSLADCQHFVKLVSRNQEQGYLVAVMSNIAVIETGRQHLLHETIFSELISFLTMPGNMIVRRSTARLLRNLSFDTKTHAMLLEHLPLIVYPLVGGEEIEEEEMDKLPIDLQYLPEDKRREPDLQTRVLLSDTLFQLGGTYSVRERFREENYYVLLKNYDQWEEDMDARERIQNVIYLIVQDDGEVDLRKEGEFPEGIEEGKDELVVVKREDERENKDEKVIGNAGS